MLSKLPTAELSRILVLLRLDRLSETGLSATEGAGGSVRVEHYKYGLLLQSEIYVANVCIRGCGPDGILFAGTATYENVFGPPVST